MTNKYFSIEPEARVITSNEELFRKYKLEGKSVIFVDEYMPLDPVDIQKLLSDISNTYMCDDSMGDNDRLLWAVTSGGAGDVGNIITDRYRLWIQIQADRSKYENLYCFVDSTNTELCRVSEKTIRYEKKKSRFVNGKAAVKYITSDFFLGIKMFFVCIRNLINDVLLMLKCPRVNGREGQNESYSYGYCLVSDSVRHFEWLMSEIDDIKKIGKYRVVVMGGHATYLRLLKAGISADEVEQWTVKEIVRKQIIAYNLLCLKVKKKFANRCFPPYLHRIDLLEHINNMVHEVYLYCGLYASYFNSNEFEYIEPWSSSSYPETRACYVTSGGAKMTRTNGMEFWDTEYPEPFPNIFSDVFVEEVGVDIEALFRNCGYIGNIIKMTFANNRLYKAYCANDFENNANGFSSVLIGVSGGIPGIKCEEHCRVFARESIEVIREFTDRILLKLHPCYYDTAYEKFYKNLCDENDIEFIDSRSSGDEAIKQVGVVVSNGSSLIFDTMCNRKPVVAFLCKSEYFHLSYLEKYASVVKTKEELRHVLSSLKSMDIRESIVSKQNTFFEKCRNSGTNKWDYLNDKIEARTTRRRFY